MCTAVAEEATKNRNSSYKSLTHDQSSYNFSMLFKTDHERLMHAKSQYFTHHEGLRG